MKTITRKRFPWWSIGLAGLLIGLVLAYGLIYVDFRHSNTPTHFHANIAIFINGTRVDLSGNQYMEDVGSCSVDPAKQTPRERTHLHNNVPDVVHVHANGVTWGNFLTNIGFSVDTTRLITDTNTEYRAGGGKSMHFILNGKAINNPSNLLIGNEDRLLISFGNENEQQLTITQYLSVPQTAHTYNTNQDPASCSGDHAPDWSFFFWR